TPPPASAAAPAHGLTPHYFFFTSFFSSATTAGASSSLTELYPNRAATLPLLPTMTVRWASLLVVQPFRPSLPLTPVRAVFSKCSDICTADMRFFPASSSSVSHTTTP